MYFFFFYITVSHKNDKNVSEIGKYSWKYLFKPALNRIMRRNDVCVSSE